MASSLSISPGLKPPTQLTLVRSRPVEFNADFLDRRMREHRQWQHRVLDETMAELFREIAEAKTARAR
jgi:hypothetical protein